MPHKADGREPSVRLQNIGITLKSLDLFNLILEELEEHHILKELLRDEPSYEKKDLLDTLQNYSDPKTHLIPRLIRAIGDDGTELNPHNRPRSGSTRFCGRTRILDPCNPPCCDVFFLGEQVPGS